MAVTEGSLTERLGQFLTDLLAPLNAIKDAAQAWMLSDYPPYPRGNAYSFEAHLRTLSGIVPSLYNRAIDIQALLTTMSNTLTGIEGKLQAQVNLQTAILAAIGDDDSTQSVRQALFELSDNALITGKTNLFDLKTGNTTTADLLIEANTIATAIKNRLGTAANGLSIAELGQVISECICELNSKTPDPDPPADTFPAGHACAPADAELLFMVEPTDWEEYSTGNWSAAPASFVSSLMAGWTIETVTASGESVTTRAIVAPWDDPELITSCFVTSSSSTELIETVNNQIGTPISGSPGEVTYSLSANADNVSNNSTGCKALSLAGPLEAVRYHRFRVQIAGDMGAKPTSTLYFYVVPE